MPGKPFKFLRPGKLIDRDLQLVLVRKVPGNPAKRHVPAYEFEMRHPGKTTVIGHIRLRIGSAPVLRIAGNVGYDVNSRFRGHRYAARSCRLLLPFAHAHGMKSLWLTVQPNNIPSQKTCKLLGACWIDTVRIPKEHDLYARGVRYHRRYRLDLRESCCPPSAAGGAVSSPFENQKDAHEKKRELESLKDF